MIDIHSTATGICTALQNQPARCTARPNVHTCWCCIALLLLSCVFKTRLCCAVMAMPCCAPGPDGGGWLLAVKSWNGDSTPDRVVAAERCSVMRVSGSSGPARRCCSVSRSRTSSVCACSSIVGMSATDGKHDTANRHSKHEQGNCQRAWHYCRS